MASKAFKIVLVGEASTGKTSIIQRYCNEPFNASEQVSVGLGCRVKTISVDGQECVLTLWDTAGQERFYAVCRTCYRGAHAVIFVYDIGSYKSFQQLVIV